jgi:meso-butanediol dehydrogenase / (S,S)-butanediol dehydrogenase / diacetyl reductase
MGRFDGRGVVVTGAAQGMGRAIAAAFLAEGARVVLSDMNAKGVEETAGQLDAGGRAFAVRCDVTKADDVNHLVESSVEQLGAVDVFVNNAGTITMRRVVELSEDEWDTVMDVNAKGVFLCTRAILPHMLERKSGSIVNIASQAGKRGYKLFAHYCASKAAVIVFSKGVALEVAPDVRVNCVCPGIVNTDMMEREYGWEEAMTGEPKESIQKRWMSGIPMGRFQEPEHIARVALFLASDDASEMTGQAINVTGGMVME